MAGFETIGSALQQRAQQNHYRHRRVMASAQGREMELDGRLLLNFCSNDYLGLAAEPRVSAALQAGARDWGAGSGASHLVCGHNTAHQELESALAELSGRPRALLFSSGYAANTGAIAALLGRGDRILQDRLNHASLLDGALLSGARLQRYRHRDLGHLANHLDDCSNSKHRKLVVSDGTFSMDGTTCDIEGLAQLAQKHDAWLMVDEAHSFGVLGPGGRGLIAGNNIGSDAVQVLTGTLGKAFGTHGGFIAGDDAVIETLIQFARPYIYSTALPPALAVATLASLDIASREDWRRERLAELVRYFRQGATQLGLQLGDSVTPIQPVLLGDEGRALAWSSALESQGLLVSAIRPPTVPAGTSRLRITLTANHSLADIDRLLQSLNQARALTAA